MAAVDRCKGKTASSILAIFRNSFPGRGRWGDLMYIYPCHNAHTLYSLLAQASGHWGTSPSPSEHSSTSMADLGQIAEEVCELLAPRLDALKKRAKEDSERH